MEKDIHRNTSSLLRTSLNSRLIRCTAMFAISASAEPLLKEAMDSECVSLSLCDLGVLGLLHGYTQSLLSLLLFT